MTTAPWGTPEYIRQQNQEMLQRQAEQKARETANRKHLDTLAGISGQAAPLYGNYNHFYNGRSMAGRDHEGKLPSYSPTVKRGPEGNTGASSSGGGLFDAIVLIGIITAVIWAVA